MTSIRLGAYALTLAVLVLPADAQAQAAAEVDLEAVTRPELRVLPRSAQVSIDGRLDEAVWQDIQPITRFIQAEPNAGAPASEATEVRIFYDEDRLYIGAELYDRDPSGIIVRSIERDSPGILFEEMDALGISLDTFLDRRSSFLFFINAMGGLKDGQGFDNGRSRDYGWDAIVDLKTTIHENGWTLEMSIPWKTLRFDPTLPDQEWGLNLMRRVRRRNEVSYWAPLDRRNRIFLMAEAGTMTGLGQLPAGRNLWVKPFALTSRSTGDAVAADGDGGGQDFDGRNTGADTAVAQSHRFHHFGHPMSLGFPRPAVHDIADQQSGQPHHHKQAEYITQGGLYPTSQVTNTGQQPHKDDCTQSGSHTNDNGRRNQHDRIRRLDPVDNLP